VCATRSIAGGTSSIRQTTLNSSRKLIENSGLQDQYSLLSVTSLAPFAPRTLRLFDPLALPPLRQNYPLLSPFSDFRKRATKSPIRNRSTQSTFVQPNCNEIPPPLLARCSSSAHCRLPTTEVTKLTKPTSFCHSHTSRTLRFLDPRRKSL